jgi:alpha-D-ribose 1-methylphosphonate 5-triphosphate synthase subunit PhnH
MFDDDKGGAADGPVRETAFDETCHSQRVFRTLLAAMSEPGRVLGLEPAGFSGVPDGLNPFLLSLLKTLCDAEVSLALAGAPHHGWIRYLSVNTEARAAGPEAADFAVFPGSPAHPAFSSLRKGSLEFPEQGATAVLVVRAVEEGAGTGNGRRDVVLSFRGPGVPGVRRAAVSGLDPRYVQELGRANRNPPTGVDAILLDDSGRLLGVPRSARVEVTPWDM